MAVSVAVESCRAPSLESAERDGLRFRFEQKVEKTPTCWLWTGSVVRSHGYGQIRGKRDGRWTMFKAHRVAYELYVGPIPEGLTLDHLCRVRTCVNPAHLEPVTIRENLLRGNGWSGRHARQTHCLRGHAFTPENTIVRMLRRSAQPGRECRTCARARKAAR